jgi:hypothetical protein
MNRDGQLSKFEHAHHVAGFDPDKIGNTQVLPHIDSSCSERLAALVCSAPAGCMQDLGLDRDSPNVRSDSLIQNRVVRCISICNDLKSSDHRIISYSKFQASCKAFQIWNKHFRRVRCELLYLKTFSSRT